MSEVTRLEVVKGWMRDKLRGIVSVQACLLPPGNSLVVHTWTGVVINIYLIEEPVKTRAIKNVLREGTEIGIGSLFVINANLLPADGTRFDPGEWLQALHTLMHERVYAFRLDGDEPRLLQAHFESVGTTGQFGIKYGPEVTFDKLRYFRTSVKQKLIKGDWHIADFGFNAFWKDPYRVDYRAEYRRPDNGEYRWRSWSQTTWEQTHDAPLRPASRQTQLEECFALLEINPDASREEVKAAFRRMAMTVHPDTSELPKDEAEAKFRAINDAYERIKTIRKW